MDLAPAHSAVPRMALLPVLLTAAASFVAAACFGAVALALRRRRYSPELREAGQAYVLWWAMFCVQAVTDALRMLMGAVEPVDVQVYLALAALKIVAAGVGIWALARYVLFLWSGSRWLSIPLMAFAASHAGLFLWLLYRGLPATIEVGVWAPRLVLSGASPLPGGIGPLVLVFFFVPPILLALAYFALRPRMETRTQKVRVTAIALALLVFQVVATIQFNPSTSADTPIFALLALINAAVGLFIYATYNPPPWMTRVFGIEGLAKEPARDDIDPELLLR